MWRCNIGYSSVIEVDEILAQSVTGSRPDSTGTRVKLVNISGTVNSGSNQIPTDIVEQFIRLADSQIDGVLSQMYKPPFKKCAYGEWALDADIDEYNQNVELVDSNNLIRGDEILIRNDDTGDEELHIVDQIIDQNTVSTVEPITLHFSGDQIRVIRIDHPQPIPQISARLAAANIYDKYYAAQSSPNISDFGKEQRVMATGQLNDILNGRTQLDCQERIGDRFGNPWIDSNYSVREGPQKFDSGRDMSRPK